MTSQSVVLQAYPGPASSCTLEAHLQPKAVFLCLLLLLCMLDLLCLVIYLTPLPSLSLCRASETLIVCAEVPGMENMSKLQLPLNSDRIWRGSYKGHDWRHLVS